MEKNERALHRGARGRGDGTAPGSDLNPPILRSAEGVKSQFYRNFGKRALDISLAIISMPILLPVFLVLYLVVRRDGGSFIYHHTRIGKNGETFECLKIRTMVMDSEAILARVLESDPVLAKEWQTQFKLKNDPRITKFGHILRATALDELPQIFNVLLGEMSFVGPRPITEAELTLYGRYSEKYVTVRPGLTGPWQISGRRDANYSSRAKQDAEYVESITLLLDISIMLATVPEMLFARGR